MIIFFQLIEQAVESFNENDCSSLLEVPSQVSVLAAQIFCTGQIDTALSGTAAERQAHELRVSQFLSRMHATFKKSGTKVHTMTAESASLMSIFYRDLLHGVPPAENSTSHGWWAGLKFYIVDELVEIRMLDKVRIIYDIQVDPNSFLHHCL